MKKAVPYSLFALLAVGVLLPALYLYGPWRPKPQPVFDHSHGCIAQIALPSGYERTPDGGDDFAAFLRSLPLAADTVPVRRITGEVADSLVPYTYRVIDLPLLHRHEQCADVCIYLRAEYLFRSRQFLKIHFQDTQYHTMRYYWGGRRSRFIPYLLRVFKYANTESLIHEMPSRRLSEMQVGDVFVYSVKDRTDQRYGHAIIVADMAVNRVTGQKLFMLAQGSTPACSIHILCNRKNDELSPWFALDEVASTIDLGTATYQANELRYFSERYFDWDHYDTMHFEYRPKILRKAMQQDGHKERPS